MSGLEEFFEQMRPFLLGERDASEVEDVLGQSASGTENLGFYRTLMARNFEKFLKDMYPTVFTVAQRVRDGLWIELVQDYSRATVPEHHDPNMFSRDFPQFLAARREREADGSELPEILEQLADLQWLRHEVNVAPDVDGDGFEQRLFLRQYSYPVPQFYRAVSADPKAPLPEHADTLALVYRSLEDLRPHVRVISVVELAALARRQSAELPGPLAQLPIDRVDQAEEKLVSLGVLTSAAGVTATP